MRCLHRDFSDLLIELGMVDAINLDGGGSATLVVNQTVVSQSSEDACPQGALPHCEVEGCSDRLKYYCERPVLPPPRVLFRFRH